MAEKKPNTKQTKTIIALKAIEKKNKLRANQIKIKMARE